MLALRCGQTKRVLAVASRSELASPRAWPYKQLSGASFFSWIEHTRSSISILPGQQSAGIVVSLIYTNFNTSLRNITVISCNVSNMIDTKLLSNWLMWFYVKFNEHSSRNIAGMTSASAQEKKMQATYNCHMEATEMGKIIIMLMILKSNHLNKGDLKSKSFWKWWFENQNHVENQIILKSFSKSF